MCSRWHYQFHKKTRQKTVLLLIGSILLTFAILFRGIPAIFTVAETINNFRHQPELSDPKSKILPTTPKFIVDFEATKSATIEIRGVADPNSLIEIYQSGRLVETVNTQKNGIFQFKTDLQKGKNIFTAIAVSETGQKSRVSDSYLINYLSDNPTLEIFSPKDNETIHDLEILIVGKTDPGNTIMINNRLVIVDTNGNFTHTINLYSGENIVTVIAINPVKNETKKEIRLFKP